MDKLQWFKFVPSDWMMGKIQRCPEITQARFIRLCCLYWNKSCILSYEDSEIEIDEEHLKILISKRIISNIDGFINISFLDEQFSEIEETNDGKRKSGIVGNLKRWHRPIYDKYVSKQISLEDAVLLSKAIADPSHTDGTPIAVPSQNIADKNRTEQNRLEEIEKEYKPPKPKKVFTEDVLNCYYSSLAFFDETLHPKKETTKTNWLKTIEELNRIDGLEFQDIIHLVQRVKADSFWGKQFQSITKLRTKNKQDILYWTFFYNLFKTNNNQTNKIDYEQLNELRKQYPNA